MSLSERSGRLIKLCLGALAVTAVWLQVRFFTISVPDAVAYSGLGLIVPTLFVELLTVDGRSAGGGLRRRSLATGVLALYRALRWTFAVAFFIGLASAAWMFVKWGAIQRELIAEAPTLEGKIHLWTLRGREALAVTAAAIVLLALYGVWKYACTLLAESRLGTLRIAMERVRALRAEKNPETTSGLALTTAAHYLVACLTQSGWGVLQSYCRFPFLRRIATRVEILELQQADGCFKVIAESHSPFVPGEALEAYDWLKTNFLPKAYNSEEFERRCEIFKGKTETGWRHGFLNQKDRGSFTSVAGWVAHSNSFHESADVDLCLYYDPAASALLAERNVPGRAIAWIDTRSFIAAPIPTPAGMPARILFVGKNVRSGFAPEDKALVEAFAILMAFSGVRRRE